jgi:hypothetical protein
MRKSALIAAALVLTVTAASAEEDMNSANYMMSHCRDTINRNAQGDPYIQGVCAGIMRGILLAGAMVGAMSSATPTRAPEMDLWRKRLCIDMPVGATLGQSVRIVVAYIDARPERMHELFDGLALEALRTAWPCK